MKNNYLAISLKILSVIFFVLMDVLIKKLSSDFDTFHIVFFRCFFGLLPVLAMVLLTRAPLKTYKIKLHLLRAVFACLAMFSFFKAFCPTSDTRHDAQTYPNHLRIIWEKKSFLTPNIFFEHVQNT